MSIGNTKRPFDLFRAWWFSLCSCFFFFSLTVRPLCVYILVSFDFSNLNFCCVSHQTNNCVQTRDKASMHWNGSTGKSNRYTDVKHLIFASSTGRVFVCVEGGALPQIKQHFFLHIVEQSCSLFALSGHKSLIFSCLLHFSSLTIEYCAKHCSCCHWIVRVIGILHVNLVFICWPMTIVHIWIHFWFYHDHIPTHNFIFESFQSAQRKCCAGVSFIISVFRSIVVNK